MSNGERTEFRIQTIISGLQLVALMIGIATVFTSIGKRDQQVSDTVENLDELQSIVHELVKTQVAGVTKDGEHDRILAELRTRIYQLEQRQ